MLARDFDRTGGAITMPDNMIKIQIIGLDRVMAALNRFPREIAKYLGQAGEEAAKRVILKTRGLQLYPPTTAANRPPTPYYIRGRGMQYKSKNTGTSERYGSQFYVENKSYMTEIGNRASYAVYVGGEKQPEHMAGKGWRKLLEVAWEKMPQITKVYQARIDKLIKDLKL